MQQVAQVARISTKRPGKLQLGGTTLDLRALVPRELGAFALTDKDAAFEACRLLKAAQEERIHAIKLGNERILML